MKKYSAYLVIIGVIFIAACQKEFSFEGISTPATGSLQSDITGDCLPKTVNGVYEAGKPLVPTVNTITVQVDITQTGSYVITTDTVNGYFFRATGSFTTLGPNTVTLAANGTPFATGINNFVVSFDSSVCDIQVTVLPPGAGAAVFTLVNGGTPPNCASAVVNGTYLKDMPVTTSNSVDISVNVTAPGTYTITATGGGLTFTKTSAFVTTGVQTVNLPASGKPTVAGNNTITFAAPFAGCSFVVTVATSAVFTVDCATAVPSGTYTQGVPLNATNKVDIDINVTTAGPYSITTTPINGMTFSGSGNAVLGVQTVTLTGSGTPGASGTTAIPVPLTPPCTFSIVVMPAPDWKFTEGTTTYQGSTDNAQLDNTTLPPFSLFSYSGSNLTGDNITIAITDIAGGLQVNETYPTTITTLANFATFSFTAGASTETYDANPAQGPTPGIIFKITAHNPVAKTISGTFSGQALNSTGAAKTISNGSFTATYQ